jgi:hypothetical protein
MISELEWDAEYAESASDVQDISLTQTSATWSVDADPPKKVDGKIMWHTCMGALAEASTEANVLRNLQTSIRF